VPVIVPRPRRVTGSGHVRRATLLGERLRDVPLAAVQHSPLPRAAQTAELVASQLGGVPVHEAEAAGDGIPSVPRRR